MATKLDRFKVIGFRSIEVSDWIEVSENSCLVGTNEAGKTNLLIALWKLNPANNEPIVPLDDFPRHLYSNYKADNHSEDVFIEADFILDKEFQSSITTKLNCDKEQVRRVLIKRKYNGNHLIEFPYTKIASFSVDKLKEIISKFEQSLYAEEIFTKESPELQKEIKTHINSIQENMPETYFSKKEAEDIISSTETFVEQNFGKKKNLPEYFQKNLIEHLNKSVAAFEGKPLDISDEIVQEILAEIPKFVYYSDYGNLDSEIYLPRVIEDLGRTDLSEAARAKARTLDVLFKFVKLSPKEIFELGNESKTIIQKQDSYGRVTSTEEVQLSEEEVQQWGCSGGDTIAINSERCCEMKFPDAFTPNGDGINDQFKILLATSQFQLHTFVIMNRWGNVLFETTNSSKGWDGTYKGIEQGGGSYFYFVKYLCNGQTFEDKGNLLLIR